MIGTIELASDRYSITEARGDYRFAGRDHRLARDVLLWVVPVANGAERGRASALAEECARLSHPVFLQTLDLVHGEDHVAVVLEAPADAELTGEHPLAGGLPALVAATLTLRVGTALDEAARRGLVASALPLTFVHVSGADEVRLDPIGLFNDSAAEAGGLAPMLTEFLASFLPDGDRAGATRSRFDPGADAALSLVGRWRERAARGDADDLGAFLGELRLIARAPADFYVEADAGFKQAAADGLGMPPAVDPEAEVTVPLRLPEAAPAVRGAVEARPAPRVQSAAARRDREATRAVSRRRGASPLSMLLTVVGFGLIAALGVVLVALGVQLAGRGPADEAAVNASPSVAASPTPAPPNRATLTLVARQDARVRISVDGGVAFTGVLRSGESRSWEGSNRVQVWTDNGKDLVVTVNGFSLGPLSPAVGHPDWNTVDWGWDAGWKPR